MGGSRAGGNCKHTYTFCSFCPFPSSELLQNHFYGINVNTAPANYTGHPALSLPVGSLEGLPVGGMLVGRRGADAKVLQVAYALEQQMAKTAEVERATERQIRREGESGAV
jgi:Asp-tRNA(Asn)/Glu-tRNA(Gln) amidotransferase A subunit family amidase